MLIRTILLCAILNPLCAYAEAPKIHRDSQAGVKFQIPFANARVYGSEQMADMMTAARTAPPPSGVTYTSGVYAKQGAPFVVVWTQRNDKPISRELAEHFASGGANAQLAKIGLQDFVFDRVRLRGEGRLPDTGGLKVKIILMLLKDHIAYVGFHYRKIEDLVFFEKIRNTLAASKRQALRFESLPQEQAAADSKHTIELVLLCLASGLIGFFAVVFYRQMGGRLPGDASRNAVTTPQNEPNCTPGPLQLETSPELS